MSDSVSPAFSAAVNLLQPPAIPSLNDVYLRGLQAQKGGIDVQNALAQQAWGEIQARHTDPNGVVDFPGAAAEAAKNPVAARGMTAGLQSQSTLQDEQLSRAAIKSGAVNDAFGALLSKPNLSIDDVKGAAADLVNRQLLSPTEADADLVGMPTDPAALRQHLQELQQRSLAMTDQINRQQTAGMAPGDYYRLVDVQLGNGQTIQMPAGAAGLILSVNPELKRLNPNFGAPSSPTGTVTNDNFGPNAGRYSKPNAQPPQPGTPSTAAPAWLQPPPPPVQGGSAGGLGVTPAPGYVESQKATAAASTQAAITLQSQITAARDIKPTLDDMEAQLGTKGFTPGIGSTTMSSVRQIFQRFGLVPEEPGPGVDLANPQAAQELFAKNAARLQAMQMGTLGNPTDARQELSEVTNPSLLVSKYGNLGIIHMLQGNQQAISVMGDAWTKAQAAGWTPDRYNEWMNQRFLASDKATGGRFDPRVFWFANEGNYDAQKDYVAKMPEQQRQQFISNLQYAKQNGWITRAKDGTTQVTAGP